MGSNYEDGGVQSRLGEGFGDKGWIGEVYGSARGGWQRGCGWVAEVGPARGG